MSTSKAKRGRSADDVLSTSGDDREGEHLRCAECGGPILDPSDVSTRGNTASHKTCLSGRRYLERSVTSAEDAEELRSWKKRHPQEYKYKMLELRMLADEGKRRRRGSAEKELAQRILEEVRTYSTTSKKSRVLMLAERAFKQWYIREEGYSVDEAGKKWLADVANQNIFRSIDGGVLKLAVTGHTFYEHEEGVEVAQKTQHKKQGTLQKEPTEQGPMRDEFEGFGLTAFRGASRSTHSRGPLASSGVGSGPRYCPLPSSPTRPAQGRRCDRRAATWSKSRSRGASAASTSTDEPEKSRGKSSHATSNARSRSARSSQPAWARASSKAKVDDDPPSEEEEEEGDVQQDKVWAILSTKVIAYEL